MLCTKKAFSWLIPLDTIHCDISESKANIKIFVENQLYSKLDGVGPVNNRPSTAEAPPIGKIHPFSKIAVTLEPALRF